MSKMKRSIFESTALIALVLVLGACATTSTPVPVVGDEPDLAVLNGRWEGSYESSESGRSGSITFELTAGRDTAYGDVIMVPRNYKPITRGIGAHEERATSLPATPLEINFVRASDGQITGALAPYRDPECGCTLETQFKGQVEGDTIRGDFRSAHSSTGKVQTGTWAVVRKHE